MWTARIGPMLAVLATSVSVAFAFEISSSSVSDGHWDKKYIADKIVGCDGDNVSPALAWKDPLAGTKSFGLTIEWRKSGGVVNSVWLALVLAIDVSGSMNDAEWDLERLGYIQAFNNPRVINAIGDHGPVAMTMVEWSYSEQAVVVPWRILSSPASVTSFAAEIASTGRVLMPANTSLRRAIAFSERLLEDAPFVADRKVIDISGDGPESFPAIFAPVQGDALQKGITINGLPIRRENRYPKDIAGYYRDYVIGGPGSFYVVADGYEDFARAILKKLTLELVADAINEHPGPPSASNLGGGSVSRVFWK